MACCIPPREVQCSALIHPHRTLPKRVFGARELREFRPSLGEIFSTWSRSSPGGHPQPQLPFTAEPGSCQAAFQGRRFATAFLNFTGLLAYVPLLCLSLSQVLPCPPNCQLCSLHTVECKEVTSLQKVLVTLPRSTQQILLQRGNLSEIPPQAFSSFSNLQFLSLTGFQVSSLANLTFFMFHVNHLKILDLSNNHLLSCRIEPLAFSGLLFLEELVLNNNSLDVLKRWWFSEMPELNKLFLAINRITYLPPRTFENLTKLEELVVSSNMIQYLSMDTFYGLFSLTKLDLSSNKILFINFEVFQRLQALKYLFLFQNRLTTLPGLPDSITFLSLHRNPWVCNCQLIHSMELMQARIQRPEGVTCRRPPDLAGHQVAKSRPQGCVSPSPPSPLPSPLSSADFPPSDSWKFYLIFGSLGSFFLGFTTGLFCFFCINKCCSCPKEPKKKKPSSKQEDKSSDGKTQFLSSLQPAENLATVFELSNIVRGTSGGHSLYTPQRVNREQVRFQRPQIAYLSVDATGQSIVTFHEKGSEGRGPVLGQPCPPRENIHWVTEVSGAPGDGVNQEKPGPVFMHGLNGSCTLPTATDQIKRKESDFGPHADTHPEGHPLHPMGHLRDTQSLHAMVHISFPDRQTEPDRSTDPHESPHKKKEMYQSRSPLLVSHHESDEERNHHKKSQQQQQDDFTSSESNMEMRQKGWRGKKFLKKPDYYPHLASQVKKKQKWKPLHPHPPSTPAFSRSASQPEGNRSHCRKEAGTDWVSVTPSFKKTPQVSPYFVDAPKAGEMILIHRKSKSEQRDFGISWTRNQSSGTKLWKCQKCGFEGFAPCPLDRRRDIQPGVVPKYSGRFLDGTSQGPSSQHKEPEPAPSFSDISQHAARTQSDERCLAPSQPSPAIPNWAGETNAIYEYPSPLVSSAALSSTRPAEPVQQNLAQGVDQEQDFRLSTPNVGVVEDSVDQFPPKVMDNNGSLYEDIQDPSEMPLKEFVGSHRQSLGGSGYAASSSSHVNGHLPRTDANPSMEEDLLLPSKSPDNTDASQVVSSVTSRCPLVQKMYQIDFPLPEAEKRPSHEKADEVGYLMNEPTYQ